MGVPVGTGCERNPCPPGYSHIAPEGGAKCAAPDAANHDVEAELHAVIDAWPDLPLALQRGILVIVRAGRGG